MKQITIVLALLLTTLVGRSQVVTFYMDMNHYLIVTLNQLARTMTETSLSNQTKEIWENTKAESTSMTQLLLAKELVHQTLTHVNGAIRDGLQVKYIAQLITDVLEETTRIEQLVRDDPALLLFANSAIARVKLQAVELYGEVNSFILKGGVDAMMNYNTRDELLRTVTTRLQLLRGTLFGLRRSLYWTKLNGSWRTLNPFSQWVNRDRIIINRILLNAKTL